MERPRSDNPVLDAVFTRQTIREYTTQPLSDAQLDALSNAALFAPSGRNGQPCHVRFVQNPELLRQMNQDFRDFIGWDTPAYTRCEKNPFYHNAPVFAFLFAQTDSAVNAGIMAENLCIAAKGMSLGSCIVASVGALFQSPQAERWKTALELPQDYQFQIGVCLGYPDEEPEPKPRFTDRVLIIR